MGFDRKVIRRRLPDAEPIPGIRVGTHARKSRAFKALDCADGIFGTGN
jgi:hypothetical protein